MRNKRKGWHRKKRRLMPIRYPMLVIRRAFAKVGLPNAWADAETEANPILAAFAQEHAKKIKRIADGALVASTPRVFVEE